MAFTDYYVLFDTNTDAMALDAAIRADHIPARISPTPYDAQRLAGCGVALLVTAEHIDAVRDCIARNDAKYREIVALPRQINPARDKFC